MCPECAEARGARARWSEERKSRGTAGGTGRRGVALTNHPDINTGGAGKAGVPAPRAFCRPHRAQLPGAWRDRPPGLYGVIGGISFSFFFLFSTFSINKHTLLYKIFKKAKRGTQCCGHLISAGWSRGLSLTLSPWAHHGRLVAWPVPGGSSAPTPGRGLDPRLGRGLWGDAGWILCEGRHCFVRGGPCLGLRPSTCATQIPQRPRP